MPDPADNVADNQPEVDAVNTEPKQAASAEPKKGGHSVDKGLQKAQQKLADLERKMAEREELADKREARMLELMEKMADRVKDGPSQSEKDAADLAALLAKAEEDPFKMKDVITHITKASQDQSASARKEIAELRKKLEDAVGLANRAREDAAELKRKHEEQSLRKAFEQEHEGVSFDDAKAMLEEELNELYTPQEWSELSDATRSKVAKKALKDIAVRFKEEAVSDESDGDKEAKRREKADKAKTVDRDSKGKFVPTRSDMKADADRGSIESIMRRIAKGELPSLTASKE